MLLPGVAVHTAYLCATIILGVECSNLWLLSVTTDIETFKLNQHALAYRSLAKETALVDADADTASIIGYIECLVDIATLIVTSDDNLYLSGFCNLFQCSSGDFSFESILQFCDSYDIALLQILITKALQTILDGRFVPRVARCCEDGCQC